MASAISIGVSPNTIERDTTLAPIRGMKFSATPVKYYGYFFTSHMRRTDLNAMIGMYWSKGPGESHARVQAQGRVQLIPWGNAPTLMSNTGMADSGGWVVGVVFLTASSGTP